MMVKSLTIEIKNERNVNLESKLCGRCHKPVPASLTTEDICRHCGNYWRSEEDMKLAASDDSQAKPPSKLKLIGGIVIMGIVLLLVALGLTKFLNNKLLDESFITGSAIQESLSRYAAENNLYPDKIEDWSDIIYICNLNKKFKNAPLKPTAEAQGIKFIKYTAIDAGRSYMMWLEVRGIPQKTKGKIIEISQSGLKKLTARELD